ncbi:MAG TPA: HlyD family secretion protein [Rhizomicrobium sp.]|nr:HlyD family secretion protein [Rhizomicrobium sp.]
MGEEQPQASAVAWISRHRGALLIAGPALAAVIVLYFYLSGGRYVSTDDAYIQSARVDISANVSARLDAIYVHDNQTVAKGAVLFKLDPRRFEVAVREAEARLASARLKVQSLKAVYREKLADETAAQDSLSYQQKEYDRQVRLQRDGISSSAQLEQSAHDLAATKQKLAAAREQSASAFAELGGDPDAPPDNQPAVKQALAALDRANLELADTVVRAPMEGVVAKVEQLQVGDYVQAATPLFALVSTSNIWVEANFKETDLTHIQPGQKASFTIDTYPGTHFSAQVESVSPGTGSSFSLLPPENSSGNWVKVVQRLPVRLAIISRPDTVALHAGMSAVVTVDTGQSRALLPGSDG